MKRAVIYGCGHTLLEDALSSRLWANADVSIAVNHAGRILEHVDHWVSLHADMLPGWHKERIQLNRSGCLLWTGNHILENDPTLARKTAVLGLPYEWDGTSTALGVTLAQALECDRIMLLGVPLDDGPHFYGEPHFAIAPETRQIWLDNIHRLDNVRSMSGWTAGALGKATREWWEWYS